MCQYSDKFQAITTLPELYAFRESLKEDARRHSSVYSKELDIKEIELAQNANYFANRVEARIDYLEGHGYALDKIEEQKK